MPVWFACAERPPLPTDGNQLPSPGEFLAKIGRDLQAGTEGDKDLAAVLAKHLLIATPADNAVTLAKEALMRLAEQRAAHPEMSDGVTNVR